MKKDRLLNPAILKAVAALGHTEYLVIADCGLPVPKGVKVIDVSVTAGIPKFMEVLKAVNSELGVESAILASEISDKNPKLEAEIRAELGGIPFQKVPHEDFKKLTAEAKAIIRTGEILSYANIILIGGVNF